MSLAFTKMHGLGNDFVVLDARPGRSAAGVALDGKRAAAVADRRTGVGCDQVITLEEDPGGAEALMRIRNADGGVAEACGNAARCVGALLLDETAGDGVRIRTASGVLTASRARDGMIAVDMGRPRFEWDRIPLAREADTLHLPLDHGGLRDPAAASMGNPHVTFFVDDAEAVPLSEAGPVLERHPMFPERVNVGVAEIESAGRMRLRVWERGAGMTPACGTAACAAVANGHRRGLCGREVAVEMDGGGLEIAWRDAVEMTGPAAVAFRGFLDVGEGA